MQATLEFEIKEVSFKTEVDIFVESEEWGQSVTWDEDLKAVEVFTEKGSHILKWGDMSDNVSDIFIDKINNIVHDITLGEYKEIENDHYESTLDI